MDRAVAIGRARTGRHWRSALAEAHSDPIAGNARKRLAYDEIFANQLALLLLRQVVAGARRGVPLQGDGRLTGKLQLPYRLTGAQQRVIGEIRGDMAQDKPMLRLLQGDVGSGKTLVALLAMLEAVEAGAQAAMLAPTEILARQHHRDPASASARRSAFAIAILTGREKGRARESVLMGLADGSIDILVGTHAIFQQHVAYQKLGLIVIDEQHRFGVSQRLLLSDKAERPPHLLAMTATPIPRTLTLTHYGEMDVSRIDEMPPGRTPVETLVISDEQARRRRRRARPASRRRRPGLLGLPAGRGERGDRRRRRRGAGRGPPPALRRRPGRPGPRPDEGAGEGCRHGVIRFRRAGGAGRDDRDRGRGRRPQRHADDRRGRRALRPRPAPPVARPGRARARAASRCLLLRGPEAQRDGPGAPRADARDQRRLPHRRGGSAPARAGRDPRHAPVGRAGFPRRLARRMSPNSRRLRRATRGCCSTATAASPASAARRRGCASICSNATRRWGCSGAASRSAARASSCRG